MKTYCVVQCAGYVNEQEIRDFPSLEKAMRWRDRNYRKQEQEDMHVLIAKRLPDGSLTYEY